MKNVLALLLSGSVVTTAGAAILAAPQTRPGEMTQARVWIENRGTGEAIPVSIESMSLNTRPLRVEVIGTHEVTLPPAAVLQVRSVRQNWEHRVLTIQTGQDISAALSSAGNEGWEAVGLQATAQGGATILLKRPR